MKLTDRYYEKVYKQTAKVAKKLFGTDVTGCLALRYKLKKHLEEVTGKAVDEITNDDIIKNKISCDYAKYKTLSKILEVIETACTLKTFTIGEYENEC